MPQHFRAIGFEITDPESLKHLAFGVIENGRAIVSRRQGIPEANFVQDFGRGIQLWVSAVGSNDEYEIVSCLPAFITESKTRIRAYKLARKKNENEIFLRGKLEQGAEVELVLLNLAIDDTFRTSGIDLDLHLCGLGLECEITGSDNQSSKVVQIENEAGELKTVESMFVAVDKDCHYLVMGKVRSVKEISNFHTGRKLVAIGLDTSGIELPVLFAKESLEKIPSENDVVQATIWLQGQLAAK